MTLNIWHLANSFDNLNNLKKEVFVYTCMYMMHHFIHVSMQTSGFNCIHHSILPIVSNTAFLTSLFSSLYTDAILRKASAVFAASVTSTLKEGEKKKQKTITQQRIDTWLHMYEAITNTALKRNVTSGLKCSELYCFARLS